MFEPAKSEVRIPNFAQKYHFVDLWSKWINPMQQPVEHENDMEGEENVTSTQEAPNETPPKSKSTDEV